MSQLVIVFLNGAQNWNVDGTEQKTVCGEFSEQMCFEALCAVSDIPKEGSLQELYGATPTQCGNVISCMNETNGVVFVYVKD